METIQFSPATHFLATGGVDGKIHVWDSSINKLRFTVEHEVIFQSDTNSRML